MKYYARHTFWVWAALAVGVALNIAAHRNGTPGIDFEVFRKTGARLLAGETLYQPDESMPYKYAPLFALVFTSLTLLPPLTTFYLWNGLNGLGLALFVVWGSNVLPERWRLVGSLLAFFAVLNSLQQHFSLGQIDALLFGAVAASELLKTRAPILSGAILALAALVKITFVAFIVIALFFFAKRRALGIVLGLAFGLLAPMLYFGQMQTLTLTVSWLRLLGASLEPWICWRDNQGAFGMACLAGFHPASREHMLVGYGLALLALLPAGGVLLYKLVKGQPAELASVRFALFMTFFLSPLGWYTGLIGIIPLLQLVLARTTTLTRGLAALPIVAFALLSRGIMGQAFFTYEMARGMGWLTLWLCWLVAYYVLFEDRAVP
jgi:hypothetical protein